MDLSIESGEVSLITPSESNVIPNGFILDTDKLVGSLGESLMELLPHEDIEIIENIGDIVMNNRYPNKRYTTLSAKSGSKKCKAGFPIIIPKSTNTENCKLHFKFTSKVTEGVEIILLFSKNIAIGKYRSDIQRTTEVQVRFFKGWKEFVEELQENHCLELGNYELQVSSFIKEKQTSIGLSTYHEILSPIGVEVQENEEKYTLIIEFEDEKNLLLGFKDK